jgi:chromosome segregation ATPase
MGNLEKKWEQNYARDLKATQRQMIKMKAQLEKHKGKIVLLEVGEESNREKLEEEEDMIRELQEKVKHLELEQKPGFEELRKSATQLHQLVPLDKTKQWPWKRILWSNR